MSGILYGVGVGPGDPELLTLKAVKVISACDMIGIPAKSAASCTAYQIALKAVPEIVDKPVIAVPIPMTTDKAALGDAYAKGFHQIEEQLKENKKIAFLNLGDPTVYGTYMWIHERVRKAGYDAEMISGVPSFCAVAATLNLSLGSRRENIHILPGFYHSQEVEDYDGTRILMKSAGRLDEVKRKLIEMEDDGEIKAFAVTNCGMENQKVCQDIRTLDEDAGYFTTIVVKEVDK